MAKGKKGAKEKKPVMDEATAAEFRRQQQMAAKVELRRRMELEAKNSRMNNLKITNQWRKIMRLAKTEALKKDVEIMSQNHERDVDRKDAILQMLDRDLEEAEDQFQMAMRTHLVNVDELIKLHDTRLYTLERTFQNELKTMQSDFDGEMESINAKFKQEKLQLRSIIDKIEEDEEEKESDAKHSFEQLREEIRNRNLEDINMLRISLDAQIEELEQAFEAAHLNYLQQTAQRTHDFKELTQNDQRLSQDIDVKRKKIDSLQTMIQHWRAKIRHLNRETEERNRLLLDEKHSIQRHYQQLKQRIQIYRGNQNNKLLTLSQSANNAKKVLQDKLDIAKRILQLSELSRKTQTVMEQVLPFVPSEMAGTRDELIYGPQTAAANRKHDADSNEAGSSVEDDDVPEVSRSAGAPSATPAVVVPPAHQSSVWATAEHPVAISDRLANFYRKYNKTLLDNIAIDKEKQRLLQENAQLEDLIQQFLDGTKISNSTFAEDNPVFVINGRANLNYVPNPSNVPPTVQEGHVIVYNTAAMTGSY